jgi:FkbM family methyltransferase
VSQLLPLWAIEAVLPRVEEGMWRLQGVGGWAASLDDETRVASRHLPDHGAVVFDVGAHAGAWSSALLARAGSAIARIYAFEPSAAHAAAIAKLPSTLAEHVPKAVSDHEGSTTLFSDERGSGLASLHKRRLEHHGVAHRAQEVVRTITLDAFCAERGIDRIHFLKMDIEGHELQALHGAQRLLLERRVDALSFEFGGTNIDSRTYFRDFWYLLSGAGFRIARILPGGRLVDIARYTESLEIFTTTNYVAVLEKDAKAPP